MVSKGCEICGNGRVSGRCEMSGADWGPTEDGMLEARLLTMLEEGASVQNITQDLRICEAWLGQLMLFMYLEGLFTVTCSL
jgi:hypothetical protein